MDSPAKENENSYRTILKRISAFGGVQVFNILVNLIRGKFVAMILGPAGMGVSSLFATSSATIQQLGGLGVNLSLVKEVSSSADDPGRRADVMTVAGFLILVTSLIGAAIAILGAPWLSELSFGSKAYTFDFMLLGAAIALTIGGGGYLAMLQGMGEVKRLSKSSVVGSLTGLFCGVPLYWLFGTRGIVPAMVILSLSTFLFYYISYRRAGGGSDVSFSWNNHSSLAKKIVSLGFIFMIGTLVGSATNYIINTFVRSTGSLDDVGLFQAANSLTNQYIGIVFSALAMDYFPRISAASRDNRRLCNIVNRQAELVILIATPLVLTVIPLAPIVIRLLLSEDFLPVAPLMRWLAMGVLLQGITFPLGYLFIAKDNRKAYVWVEVICANVLWITCSILFYSLFGLIGLGVSLVVRTAIDIAVSYSLCRHFFGFIYTRRVVLTLAGCVTLGAIGFISSLSEGLLSHIGMWTTAGVAICISGLRVRNLLKSDSDGEGE